MSFVSCEVVEFFFTGVAFIRTNAYKDNKTLELLRRPCEEREGLETKCNDVTIEISDWLLLLGFEFSRAKTAN